MCKNKHPNMLSVYHVSQILTQQKYYSKGTFLLYSVRTNEQGNASKYWQLLIFAGNNNLQQGHFIIISPQQTSMDKHHNYVNYYYIYFSVIN